jgi:hypothetical protein
MTVIGQLRALLAGGTLLTSSAAFACTCCGLDDTWRSISVAPESYESNIVSQLELGAGQFRPNECRGCDDSEEEWAISTVERSGKDFVFKSDMGPFYFRPKGRPEYRSVDVTFMTAPNYQLDDVADIYHELIFVGTLEVPDKASKHLGRTSLDATVVLRGLGGGCQGAETFQRWLVSSWKDYLVLLGSGVMVGPGETQQGAAGDVR